MRVIAKRTLRAFWEGDRRFVDAEQPLRAWFWEVRRARWRTPADIKEHFRSASILPGSRVVFNIAGNKYRLVVAIRYVSQTVYIRFVGTHEQYDRIDARVE